jgi:hypothetical protein
LFEGQLWFTSITDDPAYQDDELMIRPESSDS